jgi:uncharacterized membrane protein
VNDFRELLSQTQFANSYIQAKIQEQASQIYRTEFLVTMILGIIVSIASFVLVVRQTVETEQTKREIMSIFRLLST